MLTLTKSQILEIQNNEPPYLMIDCATDIVPGRTANGFKELKKNEWFFDVHWKNDPNMPGMLQIEALTQMASLSILTLPGNKKKFLYLISANNISFKRKVLPNSKLEIFTKVISFKRGIGEFFGEGRVNSEIACQANFRLILPEKIISPN